ncbi:MAG: Lrp/AsnC family transcriptional regulator, partial [Desulfobacteraceae bacterium]|nr:Lrp/AsnC family transcriptional regulator [Desulfobacteraceae bacterium]
LERGIVRNESYRELFKGPSTVYEWIWANVVRSQWIDTNGYPIKEEYYDKGYLAYCSSYRQLAKDCGLHKNKVKEYIDNFKDAGVIKVDHLVPEGKKRGQSVFVIGTWHSGKDENGKKKVFEHYFRDDVFITKKDGQNVSN